MILQETEFQKQLAFGRIAESQIARWLISRGNYLLPVYDIEYIDGIPKGPRVFGNDNMVAPDLLVLGKRKSLWVEAKHKSAFSWYRIGKCWETGIDLRHYQEYLKVQEISQWPIWLLFLHDGSSPRLGDLKLGCPEDCPTGLFGNSLNVLNANESHRSDRWGKSGMVYWSHGSLRQLATLEEVNALSR